MPNLGFVSGHDFSRAVKEGKRIGLLAPALAHPALNTSRIYGSEPCQSRLVHLLGREKSAGAKAQIVVGLFLARLKSCPDTKHQSGDSRKLAHSVDLDLSAISEM